ncbi:unnamed protein product [Phaedon cochleariae]|uniref:Cullin family profile domain-containing protein n=1 Tax=Phaedon cochleariae TaxID=80249 RepID=A0A9P0GWE2_PHACE|nr:unnamed protein product [Phaedon cochleariae]
MMLKKIVTRKVLSIRNHQEYPNDTQQNANQAITLLGLGINTILNSEKRKTSLQELYVIVENLHDTHRPELYEKLNDLLEDTLQQKLESLIQNTDDLLESLNSRWTKFGEHVTVIKNIFLNCDRSTKNNCTNYNTVHHLSIHLFKTIIILNPTIKDNLTIHLVNMIQSRRKGDKVDMKLHESILDMLTDMEVYNEIFHNQFIRLSNIFFSDEGNILIDMIDIRAFLRHVQARIKLEEEISSNYSNLHTSRAVLEAVCKQLIKEHMIDIVDKTFDYLRKGKIRNELCILFDLVKKVPLGLKTLSDYFVEYIIEKGTSIVSNTGNDKTMIQEILDFKDQLEQIVKISFRGNESFKAIIRNCFIKFINSKQNQPALLLAKYVDINLRSKDLLEDDLETILDKVMVLFRYIQGKDIFEAFYKKDLAKRLLLCKSTSQDAEDSMIGRLKLECGAAFTSKIEGMFKDINISQGINNAFKQYLNYASQISSDLCINILTSSFWPSYPSCKVNLPSELVNYQITFQKFYFMKHSGRKLVWQPNLGHCIVKAVFESGNKELHVSLYQTIVLLLFNDSETMNFSEILELTNMETEELKRTLISLACSKTRVLVKKLKSRDIDTDDVFSINHKFSDRLFRVKINQIQLKETIEEEHATEKSVLADRQFQVDAAIVRIMKNKKQINHNELILELFNNLDIPVKPYDIKKRIELLIEREYMERDKDDPSNYTYIA